MPRSTNAAPQGKGCQKTRLAPVVPMIYICFKYSIIGSFLREKVAKTYCLGSEMQHNKKRLPARLASFVLLLLSSDFFIFFHSCIAFSRKIIHFIIRSRTDNNNQHLAFHLNQRVDDPNAGFF